MIAYGALLVIVILFRPEGLLGVSGITGTEGLFSKLKMKRESIAHE
jgi:hypothetical protein